MEDTPWCPSMRKHLRSRPLAAPHVSLTSDLAADPGVAVVTHIEQSYVEAAAGPASDRDQPRPFRGFDPASGGILVQPERSQAGESDVD